jgi:membrane associated rhomboid family serine protease
VAVCDDLRLLELFLGVTGTLSGIAHFAHLGGMVGSALVIMQWRISRLRGTR